MVWWKARLGKRRNSCEGREISGSTETNERDVLKHCDFSIGTSHASSLIINDPAPHTPSHQKLLHNVCTNPPTLGADPEAEQDEPMACRPISR